MHRSIFLLLSLVIASCSTKKQAEEQSVEIAQEIEAVGIEKPIQESPKNTEPIPKEVMDMDSVWLNDQIPFTSTPDQVKEVLGKPDSVTTSNYECGAYIAGEEHWGDVVELMHFQGTRIVTFKDETKLMSIKVREWDCKLHHPKIILSGYTTLDELREVFPKSVGKSYHWENVRDGKTYRLVRIAPKPTWDDEWILKFLDNTLVEIEYWTPC
ncbi:MAG: hypothetical protein JXQ96_21060 [Cyclobacteriaceae bacterium]